jgi:hypothetical protein
MFHSLSGGRFVWGHQSIVTPQYTELLVGFVDAALHEDYVPTVLLVWY